MMSSIVWNIQIEGADAFSRLQTQSLLNELGVKRGSFLSNINTRALAEQLLQNQKNLSWVGVRKHGMTLSVELEKGTFYEEKSQKISWRKIRVILPYQKIAYYIKSQWNKAHK